MMTSDNDDNNEYHNDYNKGNNINNKTLKKKNKTPSSNTTSWNIPSRFPLRQLTTTTTSNDDDDDDNDNYGRRIISRALPLIKCQPDDLGVNISHPLEITTNSSSLEMAASSSSSSLPLTNKSPTVTVEVSDNDDNDERQQKEDDDQVVQRLPESSIDHFIKRMDENASDDDDDDDASDDEEQLTTNQINFTRDDPLSPLLHISTLPPPPLSSPPPPPPPPQKNTNIHHQPPRRPRLALSTTAISPQPFTLPPPLLATLPQLRSDIYTSFVEHEDRSHTVKTLVKASHLLSSRDHLCLDVGSTIWREATRLLTEGGDLVAKRLEELKRRGGEQVVRGGWRVHHLGEEFDVTYNGETAEDDGDDEEETENRSVDEEAEDFGYDGVGTAQKYQWANIRESFIHRREEEEEHGDASRRASVNWSLKIMSLPDLVPRSYVDMALLKRYYFLGMSSESSSSRSFNNVVKRLGGSLCGIGCDVVRVYATAYLVSCAGEALDYFEVCGRKDAMALRRKSNKRGADLEVVTRSHPLLTCQRPRYDEEERDENDEWYTVYLLKTYLRSFSSVRNFDVSSYLHDNSLSLEDYLRRHHVPPLSLVCHAALSKTNDDDDDDNYYLVVNDVVNCYREHCRSIVVLHVIFRHVSPTVLKNNKDGWMTLVKEASVDGTTTTDRKNSFGREHLAVLELLGRTWKDDDGGGAIVERWGKDVFDVMEMACGPENDYLEVYLGCMDAWLNLSLRVMGEMEMEKIIENCLTRIIRWYHKCSSGNNDDAKATVDVVKQIQRINITLLHQCRLYIHNQIKSINNHPSQTTTTTTTAILILSKKYPQRIIANIIPSYSEMAIMSLRPILKTFAKYHYHKQRQQQQGSNDDHTTTDETKIMNLIRDTLFQSFKMIHDSLLPPSSDDKQQPELTPQQQNLHQKRINLLSALITTHLLNPLALSKEDISTLRPAIELLLRFHQSFPLFPHVQHSLVCHLCTLSARSLPYFSTTPVVKQRIHASLLHASSTIITPTNVPNTTERLYLLHALTLACHLTRHDKLTSKVAKTAVAVMSSSSSRVDGRIVALYLGSISYLPGSDAFGRFYLLRGLINALEKRRRSAVEEKGGGRRVVEVVTSYAAVLGAIRAFRQSGVGMTPDDVEELHRFATIVLHTVVELFTEMKQKKTLSLSVILTVVEGMLMTLDFDDEGNVMFVGRLLELGQLLEDGRKEEDKDDGREEEERMMTVDEEEGWLLRTKAYYRSLVGEGRWRRVQV